MSRKSKAGFTLRDLVMPVALILLGAAAAGHYYARHARAEQETAMSRLTRELFDCEPGELTARAFTPEKMHAGEHAAAPKELASAPRQKDPTHGPGLAVKATRANDRKAAGKNANARPSQTAAAKREAKPTTRVSKPTGNANNVVPTRHPQAIADEYDRRCQAILDEMY